MDVVLDRIVKREQKSLDFLNVDISIVIPCLNEAETITMVVENAISALKEIKAIYDLNGEVVVADNGSTDGSIELATKAGARVERVSSKGYGAAIRGGVLQSSGRYIIMGDADGAHDFHDAVPMIGKLLAGAELCMGSRFKGHITPGSMPFWNRYVGNPLLTGVLNVLYRSGMTDAHCGLRAFTKEAFVKLKLNSSGMEFASEMLIKASLLKLRRVELSVTQHLEGRTREPHLRPIRDGWRHLRYMLLLAPFWVFFIPAFGLAISGLALYAGLLGVNHHANQTILGLSFGDHWALVASCFISMSHVLLLSGVVSYFYALSRGFHLESKFSLLLKKIFSFEAMILQSMLALFFGTFFIGGVFEEWKAQGFSGLNAIPPLALAGSLLVVAFQHFFFSFLVNVFEE